MKFIVDIENPQQQYIQFTAHFNVDKTETTLFFPAWRPGRYELGDFAKNVNHFRIEDESGNPIEYAKIKKNQWLVNTENTNKIIVKYSYYAAEMNAGSTFLDDTQLYMNPVNCCIFTDETYSEEIQMQLNIPDAWKIAHSLPVENKMFTAKNYDELADNPFICSAQLQHQTYEVSGIIFHVWFNGVVKPDWERLLRDFEMFTKKQIEHFGGFPVDEYHFLFQILPYSTYHGVEHCRSTVITLGPSYAVFEELYKELLGVSSHELYHTWNVKNIRPIEWMPYNFKKENYSKLGYIAEGVTTYMGDLMLYKSKVFNIDQYLDEMNAQLIKHTHNYGRFNYSVANSSFDTWLDGYVKGAPGRKVSIYTEGCLVSFMIDVLIMKNTDNEKSIDDVMRKLYQEFGQKGIGVSAKDYQNAIEQVSKMDMEPFFNDYVYGHKDFLPLLAECFDYLGLQLKTKTTKSIFASFYGAKIIEQNGKTHIVDIYPGSPLDKAGAMIGDELLTMNKINIQENADRWGVFFKGDNKTMLVNRKGEFREIVFQETKDTFFNRYFVQLNDNITTAQEQAFEKWSS